MGIDFVESHRAMDQPITEPSSLTVVYDISVDETIVRAACKIGFNYAAKVLGCATVRRVGSDGARRFVRYGEASANSSGPVAVVPLTTNSSGSQPPILLA
jgi:hypothetical protein